MAHHDDADPTQRSLERLDETWVRKFSGIAKQLLQATVKRKLAASHPLSELESSAGAHEKPEYFVSRQAAEKVPAACPDRERRLIFTLCRHGDVRCLCEVVTLRRSDVN